MRKITSIVLSLIMVFTMVMTVAATDATLPVIGSETLRIELEEYNAYAGCKESDNTASNNYYLVAGQLADTSCSKPVNDINLKVEKSGYYMIKYPMSYTSGTGSYSKITVALTNTPEGKSAKTINLFDNTKKAIEATGYSKTKNNGCPMHIYSKGVYLEKGDLKIVVTISKVGTYRRFALDYIEFNPVIASETEDTIVEFEDYIDNAYVGTIEYDTTASGNRYSKAGGYANNPSITTKLEFKKDGYYDVSTIIGQRRGSDASQVVVTVKDSTGNALVTFDNTVDTGINQSGYTANTNTNTQAGKYTKNKIFIPKGIITVEANVYKNTSNVYKYFMDCLKISPVSVDNMSEINSEVILKGNYATAVSGTPIIALYNGDKLVVAQKCDAVSGVTEITAEIDTEGKEYTEAKLFVWNNTTAIVPQAISKTFTK